MLRTYRLLTLLAAPAAFAYTCVRALRDGGVRYLLQRYALALPAQHAGRICVHCSSVGEVRAAGPLLRRLSGDGEQVLLSVATPTGWRIAGMDVPDIPRVYFPLDHRSVARRWLRRLAPRALLILETELWPELFAAAADRGLPLALVNARLTQRTSRAPRWLRRALRFALAAPRCVLARNEEDAERFRVLGGNPARIEVIGNLKAALTDIPPVRSAPLPVPYVLAASTHGDEELRLWEAWQSLDVRDHLLVIMPRYPNRGRQICTALKKRGCRVRLHSRGPGRVKDAQVYVVDALGQTPRWMQACAFAFVGGSLVEYGGHNVLEAAAARKACVVGPHTSNFADEVQSLQECAGLVQVQDNRALAAALSAWLADPAQAQRAGQSAWDSLHRQGDVVARYREALRRYGVLPR